MKRILPIIILMILTFIACDDRPKDVLSAGKLEDVLYDYHLAQGLIEQLPYDQREAQSQDYINAVFQKHGITEAQFDSSIVYYNRNTKDLNKIYANLKERYDELNEELSMKNGNSNMMAVFAGGGDTTNLWSSPSLIALRNKHFLNRESFVIKADTSFQKHDQFTLMFDAVIMKELSDDQNVSLNTGIAITYKNGKTVGTTRSISFTAHQQLTIKADEDEEIKQITGYFFFKGNSIHRNLCLASNIQLIRMHEKKEETDNEQKTDSTNNDSIANVPDSAVHHGIKKTGSALPTEKLKIEDAPEVRTPNSIGPSRRHRAPQQFPRKK